MVLLISQATNEELKDFLKEIKGITQEEAKNNFLTITKKDKSRVKDNKYFYLSNLIYLFVTDGGNIEQDIDNLVKDINSYITSQPEWNDVLDKLVLKNRAVSIAIKEQPNKNTTLSNTDLYSLSA